MFCASHTWASAKLGSVNVLWITAYTHGGWVCADSAGFGRKCTSCVRTSAFLHVFYVSYTCLEYFRVVGSYMCTYVCFLASICSMYVCERVCLCLCSLFKIMMFSLWGMGSEKVILWDTVCCCELAPPEWMLHSDAAFVKKSPLTKILQSITLRGSVRKCYILLLKV